MKYNSKLEKFFDSLFRKRSTRNGLYSICVWIMNLVLGEKGLGFVFIEFCFIEKWIKSVYASQLWKHTAKICLFLIRTSFELNVPLFHSFDDKLLPFESVVECFFFFTSKIVAQLCECPRLFRVKISLECFSWVCFVCDFELFLFTLLSKMRRFVSFLLNEPQNRVVKNKITW